MSLTKHRVAVPAPSGVFPAIWLVGALVSVTIAGGVQAQSRELPCEASAADTQAACSGEPLDAQGAATHLSAATVVPGGRLRRAVPMAHPQGRSAGISVRSPERAPARPDPDVNG